MKTNMKKTFAKLATALCCMMCVMSLSVCLVGATETGSGTGTSTEQSSSASNSNTSSVFDGITGNPDAEHDMFGGLTTVAKQVGNSAINFLTVCGVLLVVAGVIMCGMALAFNKGDAEVSKNKKHLLILAGAVIIIVGALGIVKGLANIGGSVSKSFEEVGMEKPAADDMSDLFIDVA